MNPTPKRKKHIMFKIVAAVLIALGAVSFIPPVRRKLRSLGA